jgi:hypothetical protein
MYILDTVMRLVLSFWQSAMVDERPAEDQPSPPSPCLQQHTSSKVGDKGVQTCDLFLDPAEAGVGHGWGRAGVERIGWV